MTILENVDRLADDMGGGVESLHWTGCGQSLGALHPAYYFLRAACPRLRTSWENAVEFSGLAPGAIGPSSLLVANSHSGETGEVLEAASEVKRQGGRVVSLVYREDSSLARESDGLLRYEWGPERRPSLEKSSVALRFAAAVARKGFGYAGFPEFEAAQGAIDTIVQRAKEKAGPEILDFAQRNRSLERYYVIGGGASFGAVYNQTISFLQSLWIHAGLIRSGEFRHGPMEIVDGDCGFIVLVNPGTMGEPERRALDFLSAHSTRCLALDGEGLGLSSLPESVRPYFGFILFNHLLAILNKRLSELRDHPLSTKRYMEPV